MPVNQQLGLGTLLAWSANGSTGWSDNYPVVDTIENTVTVEEGETTLLADQFKTFLPCDLDPGEMVFSIPLDQDDDANQELASMMYGGDINYWRITYPGSSEPDIFQAFVKSLSRSISKRGMMVKQVTLRLTGDPDLAYVPGSGA